MLRRKLTKQRLRFTAQHDVVDCGPACLKMILQYYGKDYTLDYLREICYINRDGVSLLAIEDAAKLVGFETLKVKVTLSGLIEDAPLPCILFWKQDHFVVLYKIKQKPFSKEKQFVLADPAHGIITIDKQIFEKNWLDKEEKGIGLILEPAEDFSTRNIQLKANKSGLRFLLPYVTPYRKYFIQLILGMVFSSIVSLIFPFLAQALVDDGVNKNNLGFIVLILVSQLFLLLGRIVITLLRSFTMIHINTRISISIISAFLKKIMMLPIRFFDSKSVGDFMQRVSDHHRIENFLTTTSVNTIFSSITLVIFSFVLFFYSKTMFLIYLGGSVLSVLWVFMFLKKRKFIDYKRFQQLRDNQNSMYEIITGMQEIKLYNCENYMRKNWEKIQSSLFKTQLKGLTLEQYQDTGAHALTYLKNIFISFWAAKLVISGEMSLGMMLSVSYIIGELNAPLDQLMAFFRSLQDAKISMDRLSEVHNKENEQDEVNVIQHKNAQDDLILKNIFFQYEGKRSPLILTDISLIIPKGKITAIVGASGSGKSTLLKMLLKFYDPFEGSIYLGQDNMKDIPASYWRSRCGSVMQDGYIFSDTVAKNIALDNLEINYKKLYKAATIANINEFILSLPLGYNTKIGNQGSGLSAGQRQRILIARAVYKDPDYLFFDEATSALDANNESIIMSNLNAFFVAKTVVIIAHRLSTVVNADQIIVLDKGNIVESGNHSKLIQDKGYYYNLIKNQLELGE
jgi:ATP-binding cassette, subfamily B, bacterial